MYYLVENVPFDMERRRHVSIARAPPDDTRDGEPCINGWCGPRKDVAIYAYGMYATLDDALDAAKQIFGESQRIDIEIEDIKKPV